MRAKLDIPLSMGEIIEATDGFAPRMSKSSLVHAITTDTRDMCPGDLFVALPGENFDGENFCDLATRSGCHCISTRHAEGIIVKKTEDALLNITAHYRRKLTGLKKVIAITGSVGKTTTKELLFTIMRSCTKAHATSGNYNNYVGLAHTVLTAPRDVEYLIAEIGMNHSGEIGKCSRAIDPDIAVITRIGTAHIGHLGTREMIAKAKLEITEGMSTDGDLLIPYGEDLLAKIGRETVSIADTNADFSLIPTESSGGENSFVFRLCDKEILEGKTAVIGEGNLRALSFAIACAIKCGIDADDIKSSFLKISSDNLRQRYISWQDRLIIDDSYNASLESVVSSLELMRCFCGRRCAVLGDIHELGAQTESIHFKVGAEAARLGVELLFLHGVYSPFVKKGAVLSGMSDSSIFSNTDPSDLQSTLAFIKLNTAPGDVILFKASHACRFDALINKLISEEDT